MKPTATLHAMNSEFGGKRQRTSPTPSRRGDLAQLTGLYCKRRWKTMKKPPSTKVNAASILLKLMLACVSINSEANPAP